MAVLPIPDPPIPAPDTFPYPGTFPSPLLTAGPQLNAVKLETQVDTERKPRPGVLRVFQYLTNVDDIELSKLACMSVKVREPDPEKCMRLFKTET